MDCMTLLWARGVWQGTGPLSQTPQWGGDPTINQVFLIEVSSFHVKFYENYVQNALSSQKFTLVT